MLLIWEWDGKEYYVRMGWFSVSELGLYNVMKNNQSRDWAGYYSSAQTILDTIMSGKETASFSSGGQQQGCVQHGSFIHTR